MTYALIAFTDKGKALADTIAEALGGECMRCNRPMNLDEWTKTNFKKNKGLIIVGAVGIAVRAIAPYIRGKADDPAVVVVDELGNYSIPILSGHLGGANCLAGKISDIIGAIPVITTATDLNDVFAVDEWAKRHGCVIENTDRIKSISGRLLAGQTVLVKSAWNITGNLPNGVLISSDDECDITVDIRCGKSDALHVIPKIAVLGVGCKKGTQKEIIEESLEALLEKTNLSINAVCSAATIDLKANEQGLLDFCKAHGWNLTCCSAEELNGVRGDFTSSGFVKSVTGTENVCERAAVLISGGRLFCKKTAQNGVTMAIALKSFSPDWSY